MNVLMIPYTFSIWRRVLWVKYERYYVNYSSFISFFEDLWYVIFYYPIIQHTPQVFNPFHYLSFCMLRRLIHYFSLSLSPLFKSLSPNPLVFNSCVLSPLPSHLPRLNKEVPIRLPIISYNANIQHPINPFNITSAHSEHEFNLLGICI